MTSLILETEGDRSADPGFELSFTPAEWCSVLEDPCFLAEDDNSYCPRRLMGLPVRIVPDHRFG